MSRKAVKPIIDAPHLPKSNTQRFAMLKRLAELRPGEWVAIDSFKPAMGNPCSAKEMLVKKHGWHIEETDSAPDIPGRISKGHYRLAPEHYELAREMMDKYYACQGKGGGA